MRRTLPREGDGGSGELSFERSVPKPKYRRLNTFQQRPDGPSPSRRCSHPSSQMLAAARTRSTLSPPPSPRLLMLARVARQTTVNAARTFSTSSSAMLEIKTMTVFVSLASCSPRAPSSILPLLRPCRRAGRWMRYIGQLLMRYEGTGSWIDGIWYRTSRSRERGQGQYVHPSYLSPLAPS
jgi:hypothetical protein